MMLRKGITMVLFTTALTVASARASESKDLVQTAQTDHRLRTLTSLVVKAGLVDALKGDGPFTVFAPTNEAFAKLPKEVLGQLTKKENVDQLRAILKYHVAAGRLTSSDILAESRAITLQGIGLPFGLRVGNANVIQADLHASNGVVHLIDRVLLPPTPKPVVAAKAIEDGINAAIERGVGLYNAGDPKACADVYAEAARSILRRDAKDVPALHRERLEAALADAGDAKSRAWALRRSFDAILGDVAFEPRMEAPLPEGFPKPGPVGAIVEKRYPAYRAARTEGGNAFWRLFNHIKKNDVKMTAPVEMTMDDSMREVDMAFLYEKTSQGSAGADGKVAVLDLEPIRVLSLGMRGGRSKADVAMARELIERHARENGLRIAGSWRMLGYNSPMVPKASRYWELQVPVSTPNP